jgi:hypothetical protein
MLVMLVMLVSDPGRPMSADRTDTDADANDKTPSPDRHPSPPPDRPGTEGYPSRAEGRRGAAAANEITQPVNDAGSGEDDAKNATDRSSTSRSTVDMLDARGLSTKETTGTTGTDDDAPRDQLKGPATDAETDRPSTAEAQETPDYESPEQVVARRAGELQEQLPEKSRGRVTMAVGIVDDNGTKTTIVGTSEPRGYLRPGVSLEKGEVVAPGNGHAETDIIDWAEQRERSVITIGAGRPICPTCAEEIRRVDAQPATRLKEEK